MLTLLANIKFCIFCLSFIFNEFSNNYSQLNKEGSYSHFITYANPIEKFHDLSTYLCNYLLIYFK